MSKDEGWSHFLQKFIFVGNMLFCMNETSSQKYFSLNKQIVELVQNVDLCSYYYWDTIVSGNEAFNFLLVM